MSVVKNKSTERGREFWDHCEKVAAEVATWPAWKRGGNSMTEETIETILKHPAMPGQSFDSLKYVLYATYENHSEPAPLTFSERPEGTYEEWESKWVRDPIPVEWGKRIGVYAVPKEELE